MTEKSIYPDVSIIVPFYEERYEEDEAKNKVKITLKSCIRSRYSGKIDILAINDGSPPTFPYQDAKNELENMGTKTRYIIMDKNNENIGKAMTLDKGFKKSTGKIIICVDADSRIDEDAIGKVVDVFRRKRQAAIVGGFIRVRNRYRILLSGDFCKSIIREVWNTIRNNPLKSIIGGWKKATKFILSNIQEIEYWSSQRIYRSLQSDTGKVMVIPGPLFAVRRSIVDKYSISRHLVNKEIKLMDDKGVTVGKITDSRTIVEDQDYTVFLLSKGESKDKPFKTIVNLKAYSYTRVPESFSKLLSQRKRWFYGNYQVWHYNKSYLKRNLWGIFNYTTWVLNLLLSFMMISLPFLLFFAPVYLFFVSSYILLYLGTYILLLRVAPLVSHPDVKELLFFIPFYIVYEILMILYASILFFCFLARIPISIEWGNRVLILKGGKILRIGPKKSLRYPHTMDR